MRNPPLASAERDQRNQRTSSFLSNRATMGCVVLAFFFVVGCGSERAAHDVDASSGAVSRPDSEANQEMQSRFDKLSPALVAVRDARFKLMASAAMTPDHVDELRTVSWSYRSSLLLLRQQLFDLEREVGAEATRQLVNFILAQGLAIGPEIFGDMGLDPSTQSKPMEPT